MGDALFWLNMCFRLQRRIKAGEPGLEERLNWAVEKLRQQFERAGMKSPEDICRELLSEDKE